MINDGFMIAEVIFRHVFCRKTAKNGVMIVLLMRQHSLSYSQLFNCRINNTEKQRGLFRAPLPHFYKYPKREG
jgi:hypothetical protein